MNKDKEQKLQELRDNRKTLSDELLRKQKEREKHTRSISKINKEMAELVKKIKSISFEIGKIKGEYNSREGVSEKVSDHAIVRYLERYRNIDMLEVVSEILEHPDRRYSGDVVTTVYADDEQMPGKKDLKMIKFRNKKNGIEG